MIGLEQWRQGWRTYGRSVAALATQAPADLCASRGGPPGPAAAPPSPELAQRGPVSALDRRTLAHLAQGLTSKEIARLEARSPRTVDGRITRLCERMGAVSRIELVALAMRRGLVS